MAIHRRTVIRQHECTTTATELYRVPEGHELDLWSINWANHHAADADNLFWYITQNIEEGGTVDDSDLILYCGESLAALTTEEWQADPRPRTLVAAERIWVKTTQSNNTVVRWEGQLRRLT